MARRLRHPVPQTRNAQRTEFTALLLRNENLPNRLRSVSPRLQVPRQYFQPAIHPERLDVRNRLAVNTGSPAIKGTSQIGVILHSKGSVLGFLS